MADISPKLRGTLPAAARSKMVHHRGYSGGRGDDPHGVTTAQDDEEQWLNSEVQRLGLTKSPDFDPSKSPLKKVEE